MGERRHQPGEDQEGTMAVETEAPETTEAQRYRAFKEEHDALAQRLASLQGLTLEEADEQLKLERLLANRLPTLETLEKKARYAIAQVDAQAIKAEHDAFIPQKQAIYDRIAYGVSEVFAAFADLDVVHDVQVAPLTNLRQPVTGEPAIPTRSGRELAQSVASRMPGATGWNMVLFEATSRALTHGDMQQMQDADPGLRELNPRIIHRYLEGLRA
jgi:DNA-binding transcriptional MerR regulator